MTDPFQAGQIVPAGELNDATEKTLDAVFTSGGGSLATGITTTETNITKLQLQNVELVNGALYRFDVYGVLINSVATDAFLINVRRDTALTGTIVADWTIRRPDHTDVYTFTAFAWFAATADEASVPFFFSLDRAAGTGNIGIFASSRFSITRVGYSGEYRLVV